MSVIQEGVRAEAPAESPAVVEGKLNGEYLTLSPDEPPTEEAEIAGMAPDAVSLLLTKIAVRSVSDEPTAAATIHELFSRWAAEGPAASA